MRTSLMGCAPGVARSIHVNVLSNIIIMHDNTTTIYSLIICQVTFMFTFNIITMMLCFLFFFFYRVREWVFFRIQVLN